MAVRRVLPMGPQAAPNPRLLRSLALVALVGACIAACAMGNNQLTAGATGAAGTTGGGGGMGGQSFAVDGGAPDGPCPLGCSSDLHAVVDCHGDVVQACVGTQGCDISLTTCVDACEAAVHNKQAVGCEYYATDMDQMEPDLCFAAFIANTWDTPAHIQVDLGGTPLPVSHFARIPQGTGLSITYATYDAAAGLMPGEVVILFLAGTDQPAASMVPCPAPAARPGAAVEIDGTGIGQSFHITTDVPVVAYEINPYGGGSAALTGASLLLPTSAWDTNYIAVTAGPYDDGVQLGGKLVAPSMNIIAAEDGTHVAMLPKAPVSGGGGLPDGDANMPYTFTLNRGQMAQFTQEGDLTGSILQADKPIGFMAGQPCMRAPLGTPFCDHGEQMVPPVKALGNEYVGVMWRPRVVLSGAHDQGIWHLVGVVNGTKLTYSSDVGGPSTLAAGQAVDFVTDQPFVVRSQGSDHPFMLFTYMSGSGWDQINPPPSPAAPTPTGYGDADFVISVPPRQYLGEYVFFADPTYPETNLVVVRKKNGVGAFDDVSLDCAGPLDGWQPVGEYEWTRIDLVRHNFQDQGNCSTGRHEIKSATPFGLWVWGWGSPETCPGGVSCVPPYSFTANVSYGYPGGMSVQPINQVVIEPMPQ